MRNVHSEVIRKTELSENEIEQMYLLFKVYYAATCPKQFRNDLQGKAFVILLRDLEQVIVGFSTISVRTLCFEGQNLQVIYSGDTIVDHHYWGQQRLPFEFCRLAGKIKRQAPDLALYWLLIVKGHRTYRYLPMAFQTFFPTWKEKTPQGLENLMHFFGKEYFGNFYNSETGVIDFGESRGHLRAKWQGLGDRSMKKPDVRYFLERNPGYLQGHELLCVTELSESNFRARLLKAFQGEDSEKCKVTAAWNRVRQVSSENAVTFFEAAQDPSRHQLDYLRSLLERNSATVFGKQHSFSRIDTYSDYCNAVPIRTFDAIQPFISRVEAGERGVLTSERVRLFEETGGSSGGLKRIPYTANSLIEFQSAVYPWFADLLAARPKIQAGRSYFSLSPMHRKASTTSSGIPIGIDSDVDYFGKELATDLARVILLPRELRSDSSIDDWRLETLRTLVLAHDLSFISVWSPTFLIELIRYLLMNGEQLMPLLWSQRRAAELEFALSNPEELVRILWPNLNTISCWTSGSSSRFIPKLKRLFPNQYIQGKGLLATETAVTIPLVSADFPILALQSGFFEFVDTGDETHLIDDLRLGDDYRLVVSNSSGLYRYDLGDMVTFQGSHQGVPMLEFRGRRSGVSDICGEKLAESFTASALEPVSGFAMFVPSVDPESHYVLLVDREVYSDTDDCVKLEVLLERRLSKNPQYAYARKLQQLKKLRVKTVESPLSQYLEFCQRRGQRLGDVKVPTLLVDGSFLEVLE